MMLKLGYSSFKLVGTNCVNRSSVPGSLGQAGSLGDSVIDVQSRNARWRSAADLLRNGRCAGPKGYMWRGTCDLFAKKHAARHMPSPDDALGKDDL